MAAVRWDTLWSRGGRAADDTLLLMPWAMAADSARVYLLDAAAHRVVAFHASDGSVAWIAGSKGSGPREFRSPTALATLPTGGIAVADPQNNRISILDGEGAVVRTLSSPEAADATSLCALRDGKLLVATSADARPVVLMSAYGGVLGRFELPWADLADVAPIARQARLASIGDRSGCVLFLTLGRGFATFTRGRFGAGRAYVEPMELPSAEVTRTFRARSQRLVQRQIAAYDAAVNGGEIAMAFEGMTAHARRLVDVYDVRTGAYRRSYLLPERVSAIARWRDRLYLLAEHDGYPILIALSVPEGAEAGAASTGSSRPSRGEAGSP